jgi:GNAT superfamily N-acetyltransferase
VIVTTTYLELPSKVHFKPSHTDDADLLLLHAQQPLVGFYRYLYAAVGSDIAWIDRLAWSDTQLATHLQRDSVTLLVLYWRGSPAGYVELDRESSEPGTEVAYFGLMPLFRGRGYGKHLLSKGVEQAYQDGAKRVWLHTCTLDGPHAMPNYLARGFVPYRTETHVQDDATAP